MNTLIFHVQGSAREPYRVSVVGRGEALRIFCTCPAGALGGAICKHAAALLMGDVTNLTEPSDNLLKLKDAAAESPLIGKALKHRPQPHFSEELLRFRRIDDVLSVYVEALEAAGWIVDRNVVEGDRAVDELYLFESFKNGNRRKAPSVILSFERTTCDLVADLDGELVEENVRLRQRPWGVRAKQGRSLGSWSSLPRAMPTFLKVARLL